MNASDLATGFARCLDNNDFSGARQYLATDCKYLYEDVELRGPNAILASYEGNYLSAKDFLDEIIFESEVEPLEENSVKVHYLDRLRKGDHWHEHRCQQELHFLDGKISRIGHIDLAGEKEKLNAFFQRVGIKR